MRLPRIAAARHSHGGNARLGCSTVGQLLPQLPTRQQSVEQQPIIPQANNSSKTTFHVVLIAHLLALWAIASFGGGQPSPESVSGSCLASFFGIDLLDVD
jgi:hypothetical protein